MYKLLDVYAGAGGCSEGYRRAGFAPYGIDHDSKPLKHYPFPHLCMDALEALERLIKGEGLTFSNGETLYLRDFAAIHASPPCQYYSRLRHLPWLKGRVYWRSVPPTREALIRTGKPWIIENVQDCWDLLDSITLNGQMFGLPIFRDRRFEASFLLLQPSRQKRDMVIAPGMASLGKRHHGLNYCDVIGGHQAGVERHRRNMGIKWMTGEELSQAIPPAYTEFVGTQLLTYLEAQR